MRITHEMAYLTGIAEDAHIYIGKKGYIFDMESKSEKWLTDAIAPKLEIVTGKKVIVKKRGTRDAYRIQIYCKDLVITFKNVKNNSHQVLDWSKKKQILWARGFIDAEGSVKLTKSKQPMLSIYNSIQYKLELIEKILKQYNIHVGYYKNPDRVWEQFLTGRENLRHFLDTISLEHPEKHDKLQLYLQ